MATICSSARNVRVVPLTNLDIRLALGKIRLSGDVIADEEEMYLLDESFEWYDDDDCDDYDLDDIYNDDEPLDVAYDSQKWDEKWDDILWQYDY